MPSHPYARLAERDPDDYLDLSVNLGQNLQNSRKEKLELMSAIQEAGGLSKYANENRIKYPASSGYQTMSDFVREVSQHLFGGDLYTEAVRLCRPSHRADAPGVPQDKLCLVLDTLYKEACVSRLLKWKRTATSAAKHDVAKAGPEHTDPDACGSKGLLSSEALFGGSRILGPYMDYTERLNTLTHEDANSISALTDICKNIRWIDANARSQHVAVMSLFDCVGLHGPAIGALYDLYSKDNAQTYLCALAIEKGLLSLDQVTEAVELGQPIDIKPLVVIMQGKQRRSLNLIRPSEYEGENWPRLGGYDSERSWGPD